MKSFNSLKVAFIVSTVIGVLTMSALSHAEAERVEMSVARYTIDGAKLKLTANLPTEYILEGETEEWILSKESMVQQRQKYYTLGGVRMKFTLSDNALSSVEKAANPKFEWKIGAAGKLCDNLTYKADGSECTPLAADAVFNKDHDKLTTDYEFYWEPEKWDNTLDAPSSLTVTFIDPNIPKKEIAFKLEKRVLKPTAVTGPVPVDPLKGDDVAMLESMLWHLGMSPNESPGVSGNRLPTTKRKLFNTEIGSVGLMVGRFNYISHGPVKETTQYQEILTTGINTIDELHKHWQHYMLAYQFSSSPMYSFSDLSADDKLAAEAVFDGGAVNYPRGPTLGNLSSTYTSTIHESLQKYGAFERIDILKAMAQQEAKGRQWGYSGGSGDDANRITVGGGDERGSSGFNQIINSFVYGGWASDGANKKSTNCELVSAYTSTGVSQVNHYDPGQNIVAKAVWLSGKNGDCGRSFRSAFNGTRYTKTFSSTSKKLRKIMTGTVEVAVENGSHTDDNYEKLAKGIGGYNQGEGIFKNRPAWVGMLVRDKNSPEEIKAIKYAMSVMHDSNKLNINKRTYIWEGGKGVDVNKDGKIKDIAANPDAIPPVVAVVETTIPWCFAYGEEEWLAGGTIMGDDGKMRAKVFSDYRDIAEFDEDQQVACQ
jgi:hypothetical protein